ncbi:MAG: CidA/LrgA family protein [Aliidongia sp.]
MAAAFALLITCQLIGELLRAAFGLPLPGPVIGMLLLMALLVWRGAATEGPLDRVAGGLIGNMGLLFVPAGVGIIAQLALLRRDWLPILAGLVVSTVVGLVVTGLVMHRVSRAVETHRSGAVPVAAE